MKKIHQLLLATAAIATLTQCKPCNDTKPTTFTYSIEEATDMTGLPALQSFSLGINDGNWLLLGGRTNGFHGFDSTGQNFPYKKANQFIYVYNTQTHKLDSMSTSVLPTILHEQYNATNIETRQVGDKLYLIGGYGVINAGTPSEAHVTHPTMSRIKVADMIKAIQAHDSVAMLKAIAYTQNDMFRVTGGELYQLSDDKFYLVVGHKFMGLYTNDTSTSGAPVQYYTDKVSVFTITDNDSTLTLGQNIQTITDNYNDSFTQYHRRDLVVAPNVLKGGKDYGITIYGGVFTFNSNLPFQYPIYITGGATPTGVTDKSFEQVTNIYSAANLVMYDDKNDMTYTTIFGGLGDTSNPTAGNFTKLIATMAHSNTQGNTISILNPTGLPHYIGAEANFIKAKDAPVYKKNPHEIIDYNAIKADGKNLLLGYIYGGIHSQDTIWSSAPGNPTHASAKAYKVFISKK